jgi:hypothetical protein
MSSWSGFGRGRALAAFCLVLGALAIGIGCGGGEDSRSLSASSLGKAEFVKRADAVCARGRESALRYQPSLPGGRTGASIAKAIELSVLPALREVADRLYSLGAPSNERQGVEAFLASFEDALGAAEDLELPSFERLEPLLSRPGQLARKADLQSCVYG